MFVQMYFIAQDNIVTFSDKNTYQFRIFYSSHKFSRINSADTKYILYGVSAISNTVLNSYSNYLFR